LKLSLIRPYSVKSRHGDLVGHGCMTSHPKVVPIGHEVNPSGSITR
jgi:hypothetical protein